MNSPRDEIENWLDAEVTPLYPRTGSLERIRGRARKRKRGQALMTAAGCAVVLAAAATLPQFISATDQAGRASNPSLGANLPAPGIRPSGDRGSSSIASSGSGKGTPDGRATQLHQRTYLTTTDSGTKPPHRFRPTSVTVVGAGTAASPKFVGAVIGQAGPPCYNPAYCTSMAGTSTYGSRWYGVSAPETTGPHGATGVSQLRFTNLRDGWAFGPALYETSGGGWPWTPVFTSGRRITDLEAVGQNALAVFASCTGGAADYASHCTSFSLYRSTAGSTVWTPVTVPAAFRPMTTSQPSSASLVISAGTTGYLLAPSGEVLSGPVSGGTWAELGRAPCKPGAPQGTEPVDAQFAAGPKLLLACDSLIDSVVPERTTLWVSANGTHWTSAGSAPHTGTATSLAAASGSPVVLATTTGIYYSADGGKTWSPANFGGNAASGGFSYVGMTNATQGVAVPTDSGLGEIFVTNDGGRTWTASPVK
jgi:hypothetical protein